MNDGLGLVAERAAFDRWYKQQPKRGAGAMSRRPAWAAWQMGTSAERARFAVLLSELSHMAKNCCMPDGDYCSVTMQLWAEEWCRRLGPNARLTGPKRPLQEYANGTD